MNAELYETRKIQKLNPYTRCITLPTKFCKANGIEKGTKMMIIAKYRTFVIVPAWDYSINAHMQEKIEKFFEEEKI